MCDCGTVQLVGAIVAAAATGHGGDDDDGGGAGRSISVGWDLQDEGRDGINDNMHEKGRVELESRGAEVQSSEAIGLTCITKPVRASVIAAAGCCLACVRARLLA